MELNSEIKIKFVKERGLTLGFIYNYTGHNSIILNLLCVCVCARVPLVILLSRSSAKTF